MWSPDTEVQRAKSDAKNVVLMNSELIDDKSLIYNLLNIICEP